MNLETLNKYYEDGLLYKQTHPTLPLTIWNYTEKVQYEMLWDEITIACRGLVTDDSGNIVARPFPKFFNYEEVIDKDVIPWDSEYIHVQEKMDGSLGILFHYAGEWHLATRGSFTSDQAVKGLEILKSKYDLKRFVKEVTYLCEIIYPENRIVVDYGEEKITFLGASVPDMEFNWAPAKAIFKTSGIKEEDVVWSAMDVLSEDVFKRYQNLNESDKEGFVIRFYPSNYRVKIKFEDYVRLHKIMTNLSTRNVWETLSNGGDIMETLVDVPDEFYDKIKGYAEELENQFNTLEREYKWIFKILHRSLTEVYNVPQEKQRAVFAQYAKNYKHPAILFKMLDGNDYTKIIWGLIYPEYRKL
jgi:RNA ligase